MKSIYKLILLLAVLASSGCSKYLDVEPKGFTLLKTVDHYDQWLNNAATLAADVPTESMRFLTDCIDAPTIVPGTVAIEDLIYLWYPQYTADLTVGPRFWSGYYAQIYYYNTLLNNIGDATGGTEQDKKRLRAEALLGRAYSYFYLVNLYCKSYDPATADTDPGVPFVTSSDIAETVPSRGTLKQIYDQIIGDINAALPDLPASNSANHFRGSVASAYSVLARIYLYRREYAAAAQNAQKSLGSDASLKMLDYNTYNTATPTILPNQGKSPDAIYSRNLGAGAVRSVTPDTAYMHSFDSTDLRLRFFYSSVVNNVSSVLKYTTSVTIRGTARYNVWLTNTGVTANDGFVHNSGTTVPEMKLIIAEEAARRNDLATALQQLNDVIKCRMPTATYKAFNSSVQSEVLKRIMLERSHEFALNGGLRWLDMRRLDAEGMMPAVKRYNQGTTVIATLEPHSPRYVLQIPDRVMYYNPGYTQNP